MSEDHPKQGLLINYNAQYLSFNDPCIIKCNTIYSINLSGGVGSIDFVLVSRVNNTNYQLRNFSRNLGISGIFSPEKGTFPKWNFPPP